METEKGLDNQTKPTGACDRTVSTEIWEAIFDENDKVWSPLATPWRAPQILKEGTAQENYYLCELNLESHSTFHHYLG